MGGDELSCGAMRPRSFRGSSRAWCGLGVRLRRLGRARPSRPVPGVRAKRCPVWTVRRWRGNPRQGIGRVGKPFDYLLRFVDHPDEIAEIGGQACVAEAAVGGEQFTIEGHVLRGQVLEGDRLAPLRRDVELPALSVSLAATGRSLATAGRHLQAGHRPDGLDNSTFNIAYLTPQRVGFVAIETGNTCRVRRRSSSIGGWSLPLGCGHPRVLDHVRVQGEESALGTAKYPAEFRNDAVELVRSSGRSFASVARELGINHETLRHWVRSSESSQQPQRSEDASADAELVRLRKENAELKTEREIFKALRPGMRAGGGPAVHGRGWFQRGQRTRGIVVRHAQTRVAARSSLVASAPGPP